jgi:endonuclease G, mitochondrial
MGSSAEAGRVVSLAQSLLAKGGVLESTAAGEQIDRSMLADALEQHIKGKMEENLLEASFTARAAAAEGLASVENALNKTAGGASPAALTELEVASLEAIIEVTGRPAMRYPNGRVEMPPSALGENDRWRVLVATARSKINEASASVGRIMIKDSSGLAENIGTGWRLAGDLIVTNRHVGLLLLEKPDSQPRSLKLDAAKPAFIDFSATDNAGGAQRFDIASLVYCAEEKYVDVALLRVNSGVANLPPPLTLDWDPKSAGREHAATNGTAPWFKGEEVYVVGHPYRQRRSEAIAAVFGTADGLKRWSPGVVVRIGPEEPILEHDCSTLGGNSGSCVLTANGHKVIGTHMGGVEVDELTDRGLANVAVAFSRLGSHPAAKILRTGIV